MRQRPEPIRPGPGQESVWDYPRPPRLAAVAAGDAVQFAGEMIADTAQADRVMETGRPPVYCLPPNDIRMDLVTQLQDNPTANSKDTAPIDFARERTTVRTRGLELPPNPTKAFIALAGYMAFYGSRMDEARVGEEVVEPQSGDFYGGWIASRIVGPFKGAPGTLGW